MGNIFGSVAKPCCWDSATVGTYFMYVRGLNDSADIHKVSPYSSYQPTFAIVPKNFCDKG